MPEKDYDEMSMRQKGMVDAIALDRVEDQDLTNDEIVELAHELTGEKKYASSAVSRMRSEYTEAIEERVQVLSNPDEGNGGEVVTVGDPMRSYTGPGEGIDATMQDIKERPVKESSEEHTHVCPGCGETFESPQALGGHSNFCEDYGEASEADEDVEGNGSRINFEFSEDEAFEFVRSADEDIARKAFEQVIKTPSS